MTYDMIPESKSIWELTATKQDLEAGAFYASVSLPWTYNRMSLRSRSEGQQSRAINIAKGIVVQEVLRRAFTERGVIPVIQRKSHRDEDLFDFKIPIDGGLKTLDIKSFHFYTDYSGTGRQPLSSKLIFENRQYAGPEWRRFFPMLVPHDQITTGKDAYCFAISSSIDPRKDIHRKRASYAITAFPYGNWIGFLSSKPLCLAREAAGKGFAISIDYKAPQNSSPISLVVIGEWSGERQVEEVELKPGAANLGTKPFSCVSSFRLKRDDYEQMTGHFLISINSNDFSTRIQDSGVTNVNLIPDTPLQISSADFCNLVLPSDFTVYTIGWISKDDFVNRYRQYTGWLGPTQDAPDFNRPWTSVSEEDRRIMRRIGLGNVQSLSSEQSHAGVVRKGDTNNNGACCYVFPYIGKFGGVKETNLYILPDDLNIMDVLVN